MRLKIGLEFVLNILQYILKVKTGIYPREFFKIEFAPNYKNGMFAKYYGICPKFPGISSNLAKDTL